MLRRASKLLIQNNTCFKPFPFPAFLRYLKERQIPYRTEEEEMSFPVSGTSHYPFTVIYNEDNLFPEQRVSALRNLDIPQASPPSSTQLILNLEPDYDILFQDYLSDDDISPAVEILDRDITQINLRPTSFPVAELMPSINNIYSQPVQTTYLHIDLLLLEVEKDHILPGHLHQITDQVAKTGSLKVLEFSNTSHYPELAQAITKKVLPLIFPKP